MAQSELLNSANAEHDIALVRYSNGKGATILPVLREIADYLTGRLAREGESIESQKRLNALIKDVNSAMNRIYSKWERNQFNPIEDEVITNELNFQGSTIDAAVDGYESTIPPKKEVSSAIRNNPLVIGTNNGSVDFSRYTTNWKPEEIRRVTTAINGGFYSGETTSQITRNIVGLKSQRFANGLLNISRSNIQTMVKTTINHMSVQAKEEFNQDNRDLIIGYVIVATLDSKTSSICRYQDGQEYYYRDGRYQPKPPFHHNCRSTTSPLLDGRYDFVKAGRTRPAVTQEDGRAVAEQVQGSQTYYEWLKNQPAAVSNAALGQEKGKIFRNSGLTPEEFRKASSTQLGRPLTIEQMEQNNEQIASYLRKQRN